MRRSSPMRVLIVVVLATLPGCRSKTATQISGGPIIREQRMASSPDALLEVAVIPFHPAEALGRDQRPTPTAPTPGTAEADPPQGQRVHESARARSGSIVTAAAAQVDRAVRQSASRRRYPRIPSSHVYSRWKSGCACRSWWARSRNRPPSPRPTMM